jgi:hypothetical protein
MIEPPLLAAWRRITAIVLAAIAIGSGCVRSPQSLVFPRQRWQYEVPAHEDGQLSWEETVRLCDAARSLQVEPDLLYVRQGEQIGVSDYTKAVALDSTGRVLGEPRVLDWRVSGRALQALRDGDELLGRRNGEAELVLSYPAKACSGSIEKKVSATVLVVVGDTGTTSPPRFRPK